MRIARQLTDFLKAHPKVKKVFAVQENAHRKKYLKHEQAFGSIISIELYESIETFYDAIQFVKGPSFGTQFTKSLILAQSERWRRG